MHPDTSPGRAWLGAVVAGACAAMFAIVPAEVLANPPSAPAPRALESKVSLADLDLSTAAGVREAHRRVRAKAEHLCHQLWDDNSASFRWTYAACVEDTVASAVQRLSLPALATLERPRAGP